MKKVWFAVLLSCSLVGASIAYAQTKTPRFVTYTLAGVDMQNLKPTKDETAIFDKQKGYYLVKDASQGSSAKHLLLVRPEDLKDDPAEILSRLKVSRGKLPSLRTGHGVKIGDTPQQVTSKIGLPTQHNIDIDGEPERTGNGTYHYSYPGGRLNGWSYEAWYEFRKGRLRIISIAMQKGLEVAG